MQNQRIKKTEKVSYMSQLNIAEVRLQKNCIHVIKSNVK